ncbi:MAG: circularly permuted type 2 ATP-grasp protein [Bauldia sp.]
MKPAATVPKPEAISSRLTEGYRPLAGTSDEMIGADGLIRPAWRPLMDQLDRLPAAEIDARFARADRHLRDAGVYYRAYGDSGSDTREWPLAHVPLVIAEAEWNTIAAGLAQRADLLEEVIADIYGKNTLVSEGLLPPQLVAASPEYLRPMVGYPPHDHYLHFLAFDLGRGPDDRWWVLGDRTQAPSGAGFALENRVATGRALPDLPVTMNVHRLAGFFRDLRNALFELADRANGGGVALLTPGQRNETYFEHAYIARYLGLTLLEGADLTIVDGRVMVRTVGGPRPISVLWRRLDAAFLDPLELNPESRIGTPGLADAVRRNAAAIVNAIGSGILETRALLAFLPGICARLTGAPLALPHTATWWCGQEAARDFVVKRLDRMILGPAYATAPPFDDNRTSVLPAELDAAGRERLLAQLSAVGGQYAAQESVTLSTMPFYVDGRLEPRPVTLRAFAMRTGSGWKIMPGGFARVGATSDTSAIGMQAGGRAADVWIVGDGVPVEQVTLLPADDDVRDAKLVTALPSRAADNLFWIGRYIERAEGITRILRAYHGRLAENPANPVLPDIGVALHEVGVDESQPIPAALLWSIDAAFNSAGRIRDRFSVDGWLALADLSKTAHRFAGQVSAGDDAAAAMTVLLRKVAGFAGLAHENMYQAAGWRFLEIGRHLERSLEMCRLTASFAAPDASAEMLDLLVEVGDSVMTRRSRYKVNSGRLATIELLALDEANPRSILFQLAELKTQVALIPGRDARGTSNPAARETLRLYTQLAIAEPKDVLPDFLSGMVEAIAGLSDLIDATYFR